MPLKSGAMTPLELAFIDEMARLGDRVAAAKSLKISTNQAWEILQRPDVQAAFEARQRAFMWSDLVPLANEALRQVLDNPRSPAAARVQAARLVYDRALGDKAGPAEVDPANMSPEQLAEMIDRLERAAADKAREIQALEAAPRGVLD